MFRRAKLGLGSAMGFDIPLKLNCLQIAQFILMIATYLPPSFLPLFNSDNKTAAVRFSVANNDCVTGKAEKANGLLLQQKPHTYELL